MLPKAAEETIHLQVCCTSLAATCCRFLKGRRFPGKVKLTRAEVAEANVSQDFTRIAVSAQETSASTSGQVTLLPATGFSGQTVSQAWQCEDHTPAERAECEWDRPGRQRPTWQQWQAKLCQVWQLHHILFSRAQQLAQHVRHPKGKIQADTGRAGEAACPSPVDYFAASTGKRMGITACALQIVDLDALRELCWSGIPHDLRPVCWQLLLGYSSPNRERR